MVLALLEIREFITDTFLDENAACMLLHNRLFILFWKIARLVQAVRFGSVPIHGKQIYRIGSSGAGACQLT
jgi:hypothetical protein